MHTLASSILLLPPLLLLLLLTEGARANVEKVVFVASPLSTAATAAAASVPAALATALISPHLEALSPAHPVLRRQLHAHFGSSVPSHEQSEAWIRLDGLQAGRRYEVRVCWSAIQPTAFDLAFHETYQLAPGTDALWSLQEYLKARKHRPKSSQVAASASVHHHSSSALFHITAAADYYSPDKRLMTEGLLVEIDIILDPFILNILPRSLLPTASYLVAIALGSWFLSGTITNFLISIGPSAEARVSPAKKSK